MWWTPPAQAQVAELDGTDATVFRPAFHGAFLTVEDTSTPPEGVFGRVSARWADDPVVYRYDGGGSVAVLHAVSAVDVLVATTVGPARLGAWVPVVTWASGPFAPPAGGLGDVRLDARVGATDWLAADLRVALPTGTVAGQGSAGVGAELLGVVAGDVGRLRFAADTGPALGGEGLPGTRRGWLAAGAAGVHLGDRALVAAELLARVPFVAAPPVVMGRATLSGPMSEAVDLRASLGTGLARGFGAPDAELVVGLSYAPGAAPLPEPEPPVPEPPSPVDEDGDGLVGDDDACPLEPEDLDGAYDDDGCPEPYVAGTVRLRSATPLPERRWVEVRDPDGQPVPVRVTADSLVFLVPAKRPCTLHVAAPGFSPVNTPLTLPVSSTVEVELLADVGSGFRLDGDALVPVVPIRARKGLPEGYEPVLDSVAPLLWNASPWTLAIELRPPAGRGPAWLELLQGALTARGVPQDRVVLTALPPGPGEVMTFRLAGPAHP